MSSCGIARASRIRTLAVLAALAALVAAPGMSGATGWMQHGKWWHHGHPRHDTWSIEIVSSAPDQVSGGDALVRVEFPGRQIKKNARLLLNGVDVTGALSPEDGDLVGVVEGFVVGENRLELRSSAHASSVKAKLVVTNHPQSGPIFSGPQQQPFVCTTARVGLGQPIVDNQDMFGIPVAQEDASGNYPRDGRGYPTAAATIVGWSKNCAANRRIEYVYRTTGGAFLPLASPGGALPADIATTTTLDGQTVPYIVRWERGTMNRFVYSLAMLAPTTEADPDAPDDSLWNGRLVFSLQGGVAIGRTQGTTSTSAMLLHDVLQARLRGRELDGAAHEHALQPAARRRDGADAEGALRRSARHAALHRERGRLGRSDPAVRLRAEPPGALRRGHPAVLVLRHDHADDPRRRLRAARALLRQHRSLQQPLGRRAEPPRDPGLEREPDADARRGRGGAVERNLRPVLAARPEPADADSGDADDAAAAHRVSARVVRTDTARAQPDLHQRRGHQQARAGHGGSRLDPRRRPGEHLRHRCDRLRAQPVRQRGRAVRLAGARRRRDHASRVPGPERAGRKLEGALRRWWSRAFRSSALRAPRTSTRGARAT